MTIVAFVEDLRERFLRCQRERPLLHLFLEMGVTYQTLRRFVHQKPVAYDTLAKIEAWCDAQDERRAHV